jgi:two-component system, OmpR family, response regulator QseB
LEPPRFAQSAHRQGRWAGRHNVVVGTEAQSSKVLVVEDDRQLVELLRRLLVGAGYQVDIAMDGQRGLHLGMTRSYDLLLLDRRLPAIEGLDLLSKLRAHGVLTPALVLSALANPADRVAGLDAGAEDYLGKPFDVPELLARLRALLRRNLETARRLPLPHGVLDRDTRQVAVDGMPLVRLSARECSLLATLASRPGKVFSRDELRVLAFDDAGVETVETYVHYVRRKLGHHMIETVRGTGYQLGALR